METVTKALAWRYATKKFDNTKKISSNDLNTLKEALQLTPTSYGLQAMKVLIIENPAIRLQLKDKSYQQTQITDASHLFVLCANTKVGDEQIEDYVSLIAKTRKVEVASIQGFGDYMKSSISNMSDDAVKIWTAKQTYIALGLLLTACASLHIDATPMEGFDPKGYDEVLGLTEQNLQAVLVCPVGYRHEADANQHNLKVRKSMEDLFEVI